MYIHYGSIVNKWSHRIGPPFLRWDSPATAPSPTDADICVRGQGELMIEIGVVWASGGAGAAATTTKCTCTIVRAAAISAQRDNGGVLHVQRHALNR